MRKKEKEKRGEGDGRANGLLHRDCDALWDFIDLKVIVRFIVFSVEKKGSGGLNCKLGLHHKRKHSNPNATYVNLCLTYVKNFKNIELLFELME